MVWAEGSCLTIVERQTDPRIHLEYGVDADDTELTIDELPDSRTHQFLAFDRHWPGSEKLPRYLSEADLQRALDAELDDLGELGPDQVVDSHAIWGPAMTRITADEARVPITMAQAAMGVDWDTTGLEEGAYIVAGYTWEPPLNLWIPREGVVLVVDTLAADNPPAAAVTVARETLDALASVEEAFEFAGCVRAMEGSQAHYEWRLVGEDDWQEFASASVEGESFSVDFFAPAEAAGEELDLRIRIVDPMSREFSAYPRRKISVLAEPGSESESGGEASGEESGGSEDGDGETGATTDSGSGGACRVTDRGAPALAWLALVCFWRRRRARMRRV